MRRIVLALVLSTSLAGCAQLQTASNLLTAATKSYDNPVTEQELYQIEASLRIVVEGLLTYRRACIAGTVDLRCRENIEAIQPYTSQVKPLLKELRSFVRNDDKVNGIVVYKRLANLYNSIVAAATSRGVNLGV
jgi:hypothetical protein